MNGVWLWVIIMSPLIVYLFTRVVATAIYSAKVWYIMHLDEMVERRKLKSKPGD